MCVHYYSLPGINTEYLFSLVYAFSFVVIIRRCVLDVVAHGLILLPVLLVLTW